MPNPAAQVDGYLRKNKAWQPELAALREILVASDLTESFKWRNPCYTLDDANVVILGAYKDGAVISFLKGALLKDPKSLLTKPGENTQSARVIRFTDAGQIAKLKSTIKAYINEAIAVERSGEKVKLLDISQREIPVELQAQFDEIPELKTAFHALTPGRQRGYLMHIASAKQPKTRAARVEKVTPQILAGKGLDDD